MALVAAMLVLAALALGAVDAAAHSKHTKLSSFSPQEISALLRDLYDLGDMVALEQTAKQVIDENPAGTPEAAVACEHVHLPCSLLLTRACVFAYVSALAAMDTSVSTPYEFLGVAQYALGDLTSATKTFETAIKVNDADVKSWIQLGKAYLYDTKMPQAAAALEVAVMRHGVQSEVHSLFKARNWMANWQDRDDMRDEVEAHVQRNVGTDTGANALDFAEFAPPLVRAMSEHTQIAAVAHDRAPLCCSSPRDLELSSPQLRIGFISSDFGVHPVSTLMRGLLSFLAGPDHDDAVVYCFSLTLASSWWRRNISRSVDHMVSLAGKNPSDSAAIIRSHNIHVLIDLNGHTLHSGLSVLAYRPSPVQMSFLGYPMTTGSPAVDYFLSDAVSSPAETSAALFSEKLLYLPTHYIVNDHMQMLGHTLAGDRPPLRALQATRRRSASTPVFVFATFSNWQKIDPSVFRAWMHILARVPASVLWFLRYAGHEAAETNLRREANALGVDGATRLVFGDMVPWINHTHAKRAADLILDTSLKNGHTTLHDALMAGVPVITLEGDRMSNRAGSSALHALGLHDLTVNSFKEYVELAVHLATSPRVLQKLRQRVEAHRLSRALFDTRTYTRNFDEAVKTAWAVAKTQRLAANGSLPRRTAAFHVFPAQRLAHLAPRSFPVLSALDDSDEGDEYSVQVTDALAMGQAIQLHIGGHEARDGWWIVDVDSARASVDFVLRMDNLHPFPDDSVSAIYASHVLEHCHYGLHDEVRATLREWFRVLRPDGVLFVSVPDLLVLSELFARASTTDDERVLLMRIMYGGQTNAYDVHRVGFWAPLLDSYLRTAGFCESERVEGFDLFDDASTLVVKGARISLNVRARACKASEWSAASARR